MAIDNHIKNFTAADIERYHKGLLSARERHALEKAALDDPFLADALEGYAVAGINAVQDINDLKKRLVEKTQGARVVAMKSGGKTSIPWLRVAALVIIVGGLGLLANQFLFSNKKTNGIAKLDTSKKEEVRVADSAEGSGRTTTGPSSTTTKEAVSTIGSGQQQSEKTVATNESLGGKKQEPAVNNLSKPTEPGNAVVTINSETPTGIVTAPSKTGEEDKKEIPATNKDEAKALAANDNKTKIDRDKDGVADKFDMQDTEELKKKNAVAANRKAAETQPSNAGFMNQTNTFRGRVTDANNVGLPFARVYNPNDNNAGTYTDVAGNFNLTFPDSILNVQVKSVGFETANVQLRNSTSNNQVVMQDDRRGLSEVVVSNQKPNAAARSLNANMKLEEPEPADGWDNYDTYIANNLDIPEEIKIKPNTSGQVLVSFEVNKDGEPIKIKIEKSLCGKCDKEAIRLIKQGPKWKRSANKNGRTTVTINF